MTRPEREPYADDASLRDLTHTAPMFCSKQAHELHGTIQRVTMKFRCARCHPAITEHGTDKISVAGFPSDPKRPAVSGNGIRSPGIRTLVRFHSQACRPVRRCVIQRWSSEASIMRPDTNLTLRTSLRSPPCQASGVPFLIEGKHREALRHYLFDRAHNSSLCSHFHNPHPPQPTISSMRERYFDGVTGSAPSGEGHWIEGRSVSDAAASTAP